MNSTDLFSMLKLMNELWGNADVEVSFDDSTRVYTFERKDGGIGRAVTASMEDKPIEPGVYKMEYILKCFQVE